ncbi:MAG TPA: hypothetical protein PKE26_08935 [Kiritimatiellia bacterium]|nr:hypothetical protein [Kiritimatiellia bacterium]HMO99221.1 hypothetical protein [Kiritimatiellia bacterium]HMP96012.1 hypothetical protein [Kiritimatiellia bacterium]
MNSMSLRAALAFTILVTVSASAIIIGPGPAIGTDKRGVTWFQEFQDWTFNDLRALDPNDDQYKFNNYADTGRDIVAFYSHDDGTNLYFRIDFFELGFGWEGGPQNQVDIYLGIDCAPGGQSWFPNLTEFQTDHPWEACVAVYDSANGGVYATDWSLHPSAYLGSYWRSDLDAVEFGIKRQFLIDRGWNGNPASLNFVPVTTRDFTDGAGNIPGRADVVDHFGTLVPNTGDGNGMLYGAIRGDSSTSRAKYAVIAHANQSVAPRGGTQGHIYTDRGDVNLHPGFIRLLDSAEMFNTPINLHISGTLMMSFLWAAQNPAEPGYPARDGPTFMKRCKDFVTTGPGSLIGGVLAEHIMPYFEGDVNRKSIEQNSELIQHYFGLSEQDMKVMHVPERVIRSQTNHPHVSAAGPLNGKTFEDIEQSGFIATYLDEVTHLHWWYYPNEQNNPGWDDNNCGRWAGGQGNDEEPYHHKIHKINGVYTFMINDREDQAKFGNDDGGMMLDTRYSLLAKAMHPDSSQITIVFDDWEALAGNSFASPLPNNNADQFHNTLRWAANKPWIEIKNLNDVMEWALNDPTWVIDQGYKYDKSSQTYEWLKRASEHTYDNWYYGSDLEESFFDRIPKVHNNWSPAGMKKYGDMNTPGTLIRDSWDTIQAISSPYLKKISEWSYSAMIYETAWHDEDANPDQYQSRNYQQTFNRGIAQGNCSESYEDTTWDPISGWALRLHAHVRDMGVMKAASDWVQNIKNGTQGPQTTVYAADIDDDTLDEYVLCNDKVFLAIERWGARVIKAFVYDPNLNGGDARMVVGVPISNPPEESENEGPDNNRTSVFKDHWSTGQSSNGYIDMDYAHPVAPTAGPDSWTFRSADGRIRKTIRLPSGRDIAKAYYSVSNSVGTLYVRNGLGPNQLDIMFNGTNNLQRRADASYRGLKNTQGGEAYLVRGGTNTLLNTGTIASSGWDNRELPMIEIFEAYNAGSATNFAMAVAFSETSAWDADGDGLANTNEFLVGTDAFNPDSDGDGIPDGYEVARGLNPLNPADALLDPDNDGMTTWQEYIAGTLHNNPTSVFTIAYRPGSGEKPVIDHLAQSGRLYQIYFADQLAGAAWDWKAFGNTNMPVGRYLHAGATAWHSFTDDYSVATSGHAPTNNLRAYSIKVSLP